MDLISTTEVADLKGVTRQAIGDAIHRGVINGRKVGRSFVVIVDKTFESWEPMKVRQAAGKARWKDGT